jgi:hypothetical protein
MIVGRRQAEKMQFAGRLPGFRARLDAKLAQLEAHIEAALERKDDDSLSVDDGENMYRLLGAHRGVSEALVELARQMPAIDWPRLREARF